MRFLYTAPCQFLGISCHPTLMQAIQSLEISTRVLFMGVVLFMSTIDSCARSIFARVLNSSVVYVEYGLIGGFLRYPIVS